MQTPRLLHVLLLAMTVASCSREATDSSASHPSYDGSAPLSVDGVRPGMTLAECEQLLGAPTRNIGTSANPSYQWPMPKNTTVTINRHGKAVDITGSSICAGDRVLVTKGAREADVIHILGRPNKIEKTHRPTGRGVISIKHELAGKTLIYRKGDAQFEIGINADDAVQSLRVSAAN